MFENHSLIYISKFTCQGVTWSLRLELAYGVWMSQSLMHLKMSTQRNSWPSPPSKSLFLSPLSSIHDDKGAIFFSRPFFCNSWGCPKGKTVGRQTISFLVVVESNPAFTLIWWYGALPLCRTMWPKCWKSIFGKCTWIVLYTPPLWKLSSLKNRIET